MFLKAGPAEAVETVGEDLGVLERSVADGAAQGRVWSGVTYSPTYWTYNTLIHITIIVKAVLSTEHSPPFISPPPSGNLPDILKEFIQLLTVKI